MHLLASVLTVDRRGSAGAAGLPTVPLAPGCGGAGRAVHWGLPPAAALLAAGVVRQVHLHPHHSAGCPGGSSPQHGECWPGAWGGLTTGLGGGDWRGSSRGLFQDFLKTHFKVLLTFKKPFNFCAALSSSKCHYSLTSMIVIWIHPSVTFCLSVCLPVMLNVSHSQKLSCSVDIFFYIL